jgi:hypothetical protein
MSDGYRLTLSLVPEGAPADTECAITTTISAQALTENESLAADRLFIPMWLAVKAMHFEKLQGIRK